VDTVDTGEPPEPIIFDCASIPQAPYDHRLVPNAQAYHGIVFDDVGNLIGSDNSSLLKTAYDGTWGVMTPNMGTLQQIERLPSGDYVMGSDKVGGLVSVFANGSSGYLAPMSGVYGVRVGPDGLVYAANMSEVYRVDPVTKNKELYLPQNSGFQPKVIDFSPDLTKMYIGTISNSGKVYAVDLDSNFDPVGNPYLFANNVGGGWHDGLGVDICGNLYVNDYNTMGLYRVSPDGSVVETLAKSSFWEGNYGHGLTWGSGIGGWLEDAIYMPLPYKDLQVVELDIGVPYSTWDKCSVINRR